MNTELISIIIPAYNKEGSIQETLDSIYKQTYKKYEIIVVDDGSTDRTADIVKSNNNIIYYYQENAGQGAARNVGINNAKGEFIVFLDADDYWENEFLETCYKFLVSNPDVVAVNTSQKTIVEDGSFFINPSLNAGFKEAFIIEDFFNFWAEYDHIRTGTALIRKEVINNVGNQNSDLRISQDLEYWGLVATYGKWAFIPQPLWVGNSRIHAKKTGWSKKYKLRRRLCPEVEQWEERIIKRIKKDDLDGFYKVRGRVALGYAHNKVLGGDVKGARKIVEKYGRSFPNNSMSALMRKGANLGGFGWLIAVAAMKFKENLKNL